MSSDPAPPQFVWQCPHCDRKVPQRLDQCRCGFVREAAGLASPAPATGGEPVPAPAASPASSMVPWMVLGLVAAAAAGTLVALQVVPVRPTPGPAAAALDPGTPPPAAPAVDPLVPDASPAPGPPVFPLSPDLFVSEPLERAAPADGSAGASVPSASGTALPLEDMVSRAIPAIVSIETQDGRGSGFFAAPRTVVTNRHVVQNHVSVTVRLSSGQALPGRVDASSSEYDLAIVRVDSATPGHSVLPLGTVNEVRPGQEVIAIGLALGVFQNSVTRGIISAVRRSDRTVMLQTDAAINPGNSGGPLLNRRGEVVGVNTMKISGAAESLGFAVAVDHARGMLSGGRQPDVPLSSTAPVSQPLAPAFSRGSSVDAVREEGTRRYDQTVVAIARHAAQLDGYWDRIKANCTVRAGAGYDREWFGLWDGRTTLVSPDLSCGSAQRDLEQMAAQVRAAMAAAEEEARRASALPGRLREIRRRYRMDWPGFER